MEFDFLDSALEEESSVNQVIGRIERLAASFIQKLSDGVIPPLETYDRHSQGNRMENENGEYLLGNSVIRRSLKMGSALQQAMPFMRIWKVLEASHSLLLQNKHATLRDIYYLLIRYFNQQRELNETVADTACMLGVPRHALNVVAMSRGCVAGALSIKFGDGEWLNGMRAPACGYAIPGDVMKRPVEVRSEAAYIIVVEKDGVFERLVEDRLPAQLPCILITAKGFPDIATRSLVHTLAATLAIPVLGLVDFNPYGLAILLTYRLGSVAAGFDANKYTVPIRWLGLLSSDIAELALPAECRQPLTANDRRTADRLMRSRFVMNNPAYAAELQYMLENDTKMELQAIHTRGYSALVEEYLPWKIRSGLYL